MFRKTQSRLFAVLFFFGLETVVLSQHGNCAGNQCFALFKESSDFSGAESRCRESMGELFVFRMDQAFDKLDGISGRLWLRRTTEEAVAGLQMCSSISVMDGNLTHLTTPCRDKLDGFLCQYTLEDPCSRLQAVEDARVRYVAHGGFEVYDSETFPQGTIAVVENVDGQYPHSKYLCFTSSWLPAPWRCEVIEGGCEHRCNHTTNTCFCPAKQILHPNNVTCSKDPCADCAQGCQQMGDSYLCTCIKGYRLAQDRKSCVDVDECAEEDLCTGDREECENKSHICGCKDGFILEDGECVDVTMCEKCEHMWCEKLDKVYECRCNDGFRVSPNDPTKCEKHCTERDCPATCIPNPDVKKDMLQCFCPDGYIKDVRNNTTICTDIDECELNKLCDHKCENLFGGYRCLCDKGHYLDNEHTCLPMDEEAEDEGSGSFISAPTPVSTHPAVIPSYIKTGSVMGITVFMLLCTALLYIVVRNISKRCGKFDLSSFKSPDIDIFYLQQVTTDTYKRLSFDKQLKTESQKV